MTQTEPLALASTFPQATREQWQALVGKVLKTDAANPESLLVTHTFDGIDLQPLYDGLAGADATGLPGQSPFVRGRTAGRGQAWDVRAIDGHPDATTTREQVLEDLEGGATSILLQVGEGRLGVEGIAQALGEVHLDLATIALDAGEQGTEAAEAFLALAEGKAVSARLGLDPIGQLARTGRDSGMTAAVDLATRCTTSTDIRAITVDTTVFHEAGASPAQEIAFALASGVAYLRALDGLTVAQALQQLEFRFAATADQFTTIATLRAARRTWARVAEACGVTGPEGGQLQHAVSSRAMTTRRDPWSNLLRGTLACFAAGVGGADAVTVLPFDAALGLPDALARRMARNTQALVIEESHVAKVIDPAGGSWYVETLTDELAHAGWKLFQEIEAAGGMVAALTSGLVGDTITAHREARKTALATRAEALTGVTEYPLLPEVLLDREPDLRPTPTGLPSIRWAQWHEELRDRADAHTAKTGTPPTVTVLALGAPRQSAAKVDYLRSVLAGSGVLVEVISEPTSAGVAAICWSDEVEHQEVEAAIASLRAKGATVVLGSGSLDAVDVVLVKGIDTLALGERVLELLG